MTATVNIVNPPVLPTLTFLRRLTREEYHRLDEKQVFPGDERIELLDGVLIRKARQTPEHCAARRYIRESIGPLVPKGWFVDCPGVLGFDNSEPEPDATIIRGDPCEDYRDRHPGLQDLGLVIEVADTTLAFDRREKGWLYADANISVYWILNLIDKCVEVYSEPQPFLTPAKYANRAVFVAGQDVPIMLDG